MSDHSSKKITNYSWMDLQSLSLLCWFEPMYATEPQCGPVVRHLPRVGLSEADELQFFVTFWASAELSRVRIAVCA